MAMPPPTSTYTSCCNLLDQYIDGPENGQPPAPWNIPLEPNRMFDDHQKCAEVPHTDYVKHCHDCSGSGANCCTRCNGTGKVLFYYYSWIKFCAFLCECVHVCACVCLLAGDLQFES